MCTSLRFFGHYILLLLPAPLPLPVAAPPPSLPPLPPLPPSPHHPPPPTLRPLSPDLHNLSSATLFELPRSVDLANNSLTTVEQGRISYKVRLLFRNFRRITPGSSSLPKFLFSPILLHFYHNSLQPVPSPEVGM